jgi:hypothetical protein
MKLRDFRDLKDPLMVLLNDAHAAEKLLDTTDGQFERRTYIRSTMAMIEGTIWILKQKCLKAEDSSEVKRLSVAEYTMLSDQTYELNDKGEIRTIPKFPKLADNFRFTINTCNRLFGCNLDLQAGKVPWQLFLKAVTIRNRIMHPKVAENFDITDQEICDCKKVVSWFNKMIYEFMTN